METSVAIRRKQRLLAALRERQRPEDGLTEHQRGLLRDLADAGVWADPDPTQPEIFELTARVGPYGMEEARAWEARRSMERERRQRREIRDQQGAVVSVQFY